MCSVCQIEFSADILFRLSPTFVLLLLRLLRFLLLLLLLQRFSVRNRINRAQSSYERSLFVFVRPVIVPRVIVLMTVMPVVVVTLMMMMVMTVRQQTTQPSP